MTPVIDDFVASLVYRGLRKPELVPSSVIVPFHAPRRMCVDLVSDVLLQHHVVQTRRWLTALIAELKSVGFTTLAVIDSRIHPSEELYAILGLFEGEINVYEKETEKGLRKFLKIRKMSNQKYPEDELLLKKEQL